MIMASDKELASNADPAILGDTNLEMRQEYDAFWFLLAQSLLFAAGLLIYLKWDESVKGPWYPRGILLEVAIFFVIALT